MKKEMLLLMALGCLVPMGIDAICFRYVDGPNGLNSLQVEVDVTKIGSYTPTTRLHKIRLSKGATKYEKALDPDLLKSNTFYVTVKEYTSGIISLNPTLIQSVKLDSKAAYDISIDSNRKVTFTKAYDSCEGKTYTKEDYYADSHKAAAAINKIIDKS